MEILINNCTRQKTPSIKFWLEEFLLFFEREKELKIPSSGEISVAIVGEKSMAKINGKYRGKNFPTDVLSFVYENNFEKLEGELIFCPKIIAQRGKENGITLNEEWRQDFIHGMLHLLGMEHGEKMFGLQERILNFLKKKKV